MTEHTLQTQNLSVGYDETTIIEDLNLEIPAHKVSVIIGANGCGKSTLMKTLSRLLKPEKDRWFWTEKQFTVILPRSWRRCLDFFPSLQRYRRESRWQIWSHVDDIHTGSSCRI